MSDSDDNVPLATRRVPVKVENGATAIAPVAKRPQSTALRPPSRENGTDYESEYPSSDSEEDLPLASRTPVKPKVNNAALNKPQPAVKRLRDNAAASKQPVKKRRPDSSKRSVSNGKAEDSMWTTLEHHGVMFPPDYQPHGVQMLYDGRAVVLTPEQEEAATMFAVMKDSDYMKKPTFLKNFWKGFKEVLGKNHVIQHLEKCDFTPIYEHYAAEKEKKKLMTKEEKQRLKEEKDAKEAKYKIAYVDGRAEPVGNFRVEPPGLFRGRGEHPRMGSIKKRIYPKDIIINIGERAPVPEHPYPGQKWKEVRHDHSVTWLASWQDTVSSKDVKYVGFAATSTFKADSDQAKYEKARKLKLIIDDIRKDYQRDWNSSDVQRKQMGVALYFIDKLALRAGHEKDEDEADTVGCCTLKAENVELVPPNHIKFDFLGKDSIRYENTVDVHPTVYRNVEQFKKINSKGKKKSPQDMLFDTFDAGDLNKELKSRMDGLSVKVFRTYNASITLDRLLFEIEQSTHAVTADEKKAEYDKANKEVAILCNHQKSVPKTHGNTMERMQGKLDVIRQELADLEDEYRVAVGGKVKEAGKKIASVDTIRNKIERKKAQLFKAELVARTKEDLKTVALDTSKTNYLDPRITVAWCKRNEVPIEKVFRKTLCAKFIWAMDVDMDFRF